MQPFRDVWVVWYNDGDPEGPMILWNIWSTEELAIEEAERMKEQHIPSWALSGTTFEVEKMQVNPTF